MIGRQQHARLDVPTVQDGGAAGVRRRRHRTSYNTTTTTAAAPVDRIIGGGLLFYKGKTETLKKKFYIFQLPDTAPASSAPATTLLQTE